MTITKRYLAPLFVAATLVFAGAACGSSDNGGGSASGFCDTLNKFDEDDSLNEADLSDEEAAQQVGDAFRELEASAPAEIKPDVKVIADAMNAFAEIDLTDPEAIESAGDSMDQDKLETASDNVAKYAKDNCDIDLNE